MATNFKSIGFALLAIGGGVFLLPKQQKQPQIRPFIPRLNRLVYVRV